MNYERLPAIARGQEGEGRINDKYNVIISNLTRFILNLFQDLIDIVT
jgi:hypothetical protein